jgi:hypothetical protein
MEEQRPDADQTTGRRRVRVRQRVSVQEAADILGVTVEAVRGRIKRGKLEAEREEDGSVYVFLEGEPRTGGDQSTTSDNQSATRQQPDTDRLADQSELVKSLLDQVSYMREQLAAEREANRENRRLLAAALERIPALESSETPGAPEPVSETSASTEETPEDTGDVQAHPEHRSWWKRFFGFD